MMTTAVRQSVTIAAAATSLLASIAWRSLQDSPPAKPMVPLAASTLASNPDAYVGQLVTVTGAVEQTLSPSVFTIDQDKARSTPGTVLVIAPTLSGTVDLNTYVTVIGEVIRFEQADIAQKRADYTLDLPPDVAARFRGTPAVIATAVLNTALVDLARKVPPPLTAEEASFDQLMKRVGPAFGALRQALTDTDAAAVTPQTEIMRQAFVDSGAFWKSKGRADAAGWAAEAKGHVDAIDRSAAGADWDAARTAATTLGQTCSTCHGAYRERLDDGSYRLKAIAK